MCDLVLMRCFCFIDCCYSSLWFRCEYACLHCRTKSNGNFCETFEAHIDPTSSIFVLATNSMGDSNIMYTHEEGP